MTADVAATPAVAPTPTEIAVGVVVDGQGRLLAACRPLGTMSEGRWEFPGGKIEAGESPVDALARELDEEVGIKIHQPRPLICFCHSRGPAPVRLHIFVVDDWTGPAVSREGQTIRFVDPSAMRDPAALPASDVILNALTLPERYVIPPPVDSTAPDDWYARLRLSLARNKSLIRLRQTTLDDTAYESLARQVVAIADQADAGVLLDRDPAMVARVGAAGLHWPARQLATNSQRPVGNEYWFAVSAHDRLELERAEVMGADFATLSPVQPTATHPEATSLGWQRWQELRADLALPVYALGGVDETHLSSAHAANAQGIAAIRGLWPTGD